MTKLASNETQIAKSSGTALKTYYLLIFMLRNEYFSRITRCEGKTKRLIIKNIQG